MLRRAFRLTLENSNNNPKGTVMKKSLALVLVATTALLGGCATAPKPVTGLYANVKGPLVATGASGEARLVGRASARSVLGLIATGDASIAAAVREGGIREIHYVDYETQSFFGIVSEFTVVVYGN